MLVFKKRFFILVTFVSIVIFSFLLIDFFQIKSKSNTVVVGSKNCTENQILAEIIANLIEKNTDIKVKRKLNLEGTLICFEALKSKDIDIYPEYSGSAIFAILKENISNTDDFLFKYLKKTFLEKFNIKWLNPFGFENKYVLCMQSKKAKKLDICNFSDLKNYTKTREPRGDWVCVNVRGMTPKRALEVCRHEVGHEIFAEYCEQSQEGFDRCMEVIEDEGDN